MSLVRTKPPRTKAPAARFEDLAVTDSADEVLVYDKRSHHIHHLNRTSAVIWRLCDGERRVGELARQASAELGEPVKDETIQLALQKLDAAELLTQPLPSVLHATSQSRRTFLRRAAVGGAIAVPVIISVTAPVSAAFTGCNVPCQCGSACSGNSCSVCGRTSINPNTDVCCTQRQNPGTPVSVQCTNIPCGTTTLMSPNLQSASTTNSESLVAAPADTPTPTPPTAQQPPVEQPVQQDVTNQTNTTDGGSGSDGTTTATDTTTTTDTTGTGDTTTDNGAALNAPLDTPTPTPVPQDTAPPAAPADTSSNGGGVGGDSSNNNPNTSDSTTVTNPNG